MLLTLFLTQRFTGLWFFNVSVGEEMKYFCVKFSTIWFWRSCCFCLQLWVFCEIFCFVCFSSQIFGAPLLVLDRYTLSLFLMQCQKQNGNVYNWNWVDFPIIVGFCNYSGNKIFSVIWFRGCTQ